MTILGIVISILLGVFVGTIIGKSLFFKKQTDWNPNPVRPLWPPPGRPPGNGQELPKYCSTRNPELDFIQALTLMGERVEIDYPEHDRHTNIGTLIRIETHTWSWSGLKRNDMLTVVFEGGDERKFMPRHIKPA